MQVAAFWELGQVSDQQLRAELATLLAGSYRTEARIIAHIAEVERRRLHARDGSPSLFEYCVKQLGLSESEAFHRLTAARIASKFPVIFGLIERRAMHLTAVCLLRDYLTQENHLELLADACRKTKFQVLELLARRFPRPDVASRIRKLPSQAQRDALPAHALPAYALPAHALPAHAHFAETAVALLADGTRGATATPRSERRDHEPPCSTNPRRLAAARASIEPTSETRYRIQLNASSALKGKLELLQALTSHSNPTGDLAVAIERAVDLALKQAQKQRFPKTDKPRSVTAKKPSRNPTSPRPVSRQLMHREHVPHQVRREVALRDELQCTYTSESGCRCAARAFLQFHHEQPWACDGATITENLRLLCKTHNRLLAERDFGAEHVAGKIARRRGVSPAAANGTGSVSAHAGNGHRVARSE